MPSQSPPQTAPPPASAAYRTTREDLRLPLADGTQLYARLWRPVSDEPVPLLLEYSADRLTDWTAADDARRHPWYAGHGYACARIDARGHGNSDGLAGPLDQDLADAAEAVAHLAGQGWCSGRVGLLGHGRAATTALLLAARDPGAVRAVVAAAPTGGPLLGGAVLADGLHSAVTDHLAGAARPPDPRYVGDDWRRMWRERLEALDPLPPAPDSAPPLAAVLTPAHHLAATVPTLVVAGLADPAATTALRLLESAGDVPVHAVLGRWPHGLPDDVLTETLRWWDQWLRDVDTGVLGQPVLRSRLDRRWTGDERWPSPDVHAVHYGLDGPLRTAGTAAEDRYAHVRSPQHTGLNAGAYLPSGSAADLPPDQREEDGRSVCFDSAPLPEPLEVLGLPVLRLRLDGTPGLVAARLCDVAPDGTSTLVSRGVLRPSGPEATVDLTAAAHAFPAGHRLRVALSSTYWPWVWPAPEATGFGVDPSRSTLVLPVRRTAAAGPPVSFRAPALPAPPPVHLTEPLSARPPRLTTHDIARQEWRTDLSPATDGTRTHADGLVRYERTVTAYRVLARDPLSAETRTDRTVRLERPDIGWDTTLHVRTELSCDAADFILHSRLTALEAGSVLFTRDWTRRIPRDRA